MPTVGSPDQATHCSAVIDAHKATTCKTVQATVCLAHFGAVVPSIYATFKQANQPTNLYADFESNTAAIVASINAADAAASSDPHTATLAATNYSTELSPVMPAV